MLTKVRECEGGYKVTLYTAKGEVESRITDDLAQAFAWQAHASVHGKLPPYVKERKK